MGRGKVAPRLKSLKVPISRQEAGEAAPPEPTSPLGQSHCREEMNQLLTPPRGRASQGFIGSFHAPSVAGGGGPWEELLCIFYRKGHRPEKSLQINGQAGDRGPRDNQERPGRSDGPGLGSPGPGSPPCQRPPVLGQGS